MKSRSSKFLIFCLLIIVTIFVSGCTEEKEQEVDLNSVLPLNKSIQSDDEIFPTEIETVGDYIVIRGRIVDTNFTKKDCFRGSCTSYYKIIFEDKAVLSVNNLHWNSYLKNRVNRIILFEGRYITEITFI